jgi:RNA polymerase sigma-70 factor (ECF subfamily)
LLDIKTIEKAANGDFDSFEKIMLQYERLVYGIALGMLKNSEDAADVTQDTFLKVFTNLNKCRDYNVIKAWICRIATNLSIDYIKRNGRYEAEMIDEMVVSQDPDPEELYLQNVTTDNVRNAIDKLPHDQRILIILRDINDMSYNDISVALDMPLGTIKSRISRSRNALKNLLVGIC